MVDARVSLIAERISVKGNFALCTCISATRAAYRLCSRLSIDASRFIFLGIFHIRPADSLHVRCSAGPVRGNDPCCSSPEHSKESLATFHSPLCFSHRHRGRRPAVTSKAEQDATSQRPSHADANRAAGTRSRSDTRFRSVTNYCSRRRRWTGRRTRDEKQSGWLRSPAPRSGVPKGRQGSCSARRSLLRGGKRTLMPSRRADTVRL